MNTSAEAAAARGPALPGPVTVVWGVLLVLAVVFVAGAVLATIDPDASNDTVQVVLGAVLALTLITVPFALASGPERTLAAPAALGLRPFRFGPALGMVVLSLFGFLLFLGAYDQLFDPRTQEIVENVREERALAQKIALGVLIVLLAPISEEIFFRGFVFGVLRARAGFVAAALVSSALFGLAHFEPESATVIPPLIVFGALLAFVYERSGSLVPAIVLHMALNGLSFAVNLAA